MPVCAPGTAEAPPEPEGIAGSWRASVAANVAIGRIAAFAGGCAGAGPSSGFSGWNTMSGAVISATPETRKRSGRAPGRAVSETTSPMCAWSVAAICWSSTIAPGFSEPCKKRKV